MRIFSTIETLSTEIKPLLHDSKLKIIGVDGKDGVGKTKISNNLAKILNVPIISLDDFLEKNQCQYTESIKKRELLSKIKDITGAVIIEGVCLREICDITNTLIDIHIYVKRMSKGIWCDEDLCDPQEDIEELFKKQKRQLSIVTEYFNFQLGETNDPREADLTELTKEIVRYHANFTPLKLANYIYENEYA